VNYFEALQATHIDTSEAYDSKEAFISCDYQMGKLKPYWGQTSQPGKTYYSQKLMHHVFGIVSSSLGPDTVYVVDETIAGETDANHVRSHLFEHVLNEIPSQFETLRIFLDAAPYFKNKYAS